MSLPRCPRCMTPIQYDWDYCHTCGLSAEEIVAGMEQGSQTPTDIPTEGFAAPDAPAEWTPPAPAEPTPVGPSAFESAAASAPGSGGPGEEILAAFPADGPAGVPSREAGGEFVGDFPDDLTDDMPDLLGDIPAAPEPAEDPAAPPGDGPAAPTRSPAGTGLLDDFVSGGGAVAGAAVAGAFGAGDSGAEGAGGAPGHDTPAPAFPAADAPGPQVPVGASPHASAGPPASEPGAFGAPRAPTPPTPPTAPTGGPTDPMATSAGMSLMDGPPVGAPAAVPVLGGGVPKGAIIGGAVLFGLLIVFLVAFGRGGKDVADLDTGSTAPELGAMKLDRGPVTTTTKPGQKYPEGKGGWIVFSPDDKSFSVELPKPPNNLKNVLVTLPSGDVTALTFAVADANGGYAIAIADVPDGEPQEVLQTVAKAYGTSIDARTSAGAAGTHFNLPSRDIIYENTRYQLQARAVKVGTKVYILTAGGTDPRAYFWEHLRDTFQPKT